MSNLNMFYIGYFKDNYSDELYNFNIFSLLVINKHWLLFTSKNIKFVSQFIVIKLFKFKYFILSHRLNIYDIFLALEVLKLDKSKYSNSVHN